MSENNKKQVKNTKNSDEKTVKKSTKKDEAVLEKQVNINGQPVMVSVPKQSGNNNDGMNINLTINLAGEEKKKRTTAAIKKKSSKKKPTVKKVTKEKNKKSHWLIWLLLLLLLLAAVIYFVRPYLKNINTHIHTYNETWVTDENNHWHKCTECDDIKDKTAHTYSGDCDTTCNVCEHERTVSTEHTFVDGKCPVCDFVKVTEGLEYEFVSDETESEPYYKVIGIGTATNVKHIKIPATYNNGTNGTHPVKSVDDYAFASESAIISVTFLDNVETIEYGALGMCENLSSVTLSSTIKTIGGSAFYSCESLSFITLSNGLLEIGSFAFSMTGLTSVNIPASVETIGDNPFMWCENLTTITLDSKNTNFEIINSCLVDIVNKQIIIDLDYSNIPTNSEKVTTIGTYVFASLTGATNLKIPNNITKLDEGAFAYCEKIISVEIPVGLTEIIAYSFSGCSSLTTVYYGGKQSQWTAIEIDSNNGELTDATIYYYSETQPTTTGNYWHYDDENGAPTIWTTTTGE